MKILVCIKQVPGTSQVEIDPQTGTLKRAGVPAKMNPFDLYAIETALQIRDAAPSKASVEVVSMGPPQCEAVIREAFAMGADAGTILTDRAFGGADVLMASRPQTATRLRSVQNWPNGLALHTLPAWNRSTKSKKTQST